jgi:hypothetical protein
VRYETREIAGPRTYTHIPKAYTGPLALPVATQSCRWPADDPNGRPTACNDELRRERDALRDVVGVCNADRAAVRARAVKRNRIYGVVDKEAEGEEDAKQEGR